MLGRVGERRPRGCRSAEMDVIRPSPMLSLQCLLVQACHHARRSGPRKRHAVPITIDKIFFTIDKEVLQACFQDPRTELGQLCEATKSRASGRARAPGKFRLFGWPEAKRAGKSAIEKWARRLIWWGAGSSADRWLRAQVRQKPAVRSSLLQNRNLPLPAAFCPS